MVEELCQPKVPASCKACVILSTANVSRFVLIYDDAPGALRALCDKVLQEWLSALSETDDNVSGPAAAEIRLLFHQLLEGYIDPYQNECGSRYRSALTESCPAFTYFLAVEGLFWGIQTWHIVCCGMVLSEGTRSVASY